MYSEKHIGIWGCDCCGTEVEIGVVSGARFVDTLPPTGWVTLRTGLNALTVCGAGSCVTSALADLKDRVAAPVA